MEEQQTTLMKVLGSAISTHREAIEEDEKGTSSMNKSEEGRCAGSAARQVGELFHLFRERQKRRENDW